MKKLLLLSFVTLCILQFTNAQTWIQLTSSDLEIPSAQSLVKHGDAWYVATTGGVFKTTDSGQNWTLTNNNLLSVFNVLNIEEFTSAGSILFGVSPWQGIVKTTDGSSWAASANGFPESYYIASHLAVLGNRIMTVVNDNSNGKYYIYYTDNYGDTWTKGAEITEVGMDIQLYSNGSSVYIVNTTYSNAGAFVGETTNGTVITTPSFSADFPGDDIESIDLSGDQLIVTGENSIYRYDLTNGGWTDLSDVWINGIEFIVLSANETGRLYCSVLDGNMEIGSYTSNDNGDSWTKLSPSLNLGKPFAEAFYASGDEFMAFFIDDGVHFSSDNGSNISRRNSGLLASDFDELFLSGNNLLTSLFISGVYGSSDNGETWSKWNDGLPSDDLQQAYDFISDGANVFMNYANMPDDTPEPLKVFSSSDDGQTWSGLSAPTTYTNFKLMGINGNTLFGYSTNPEIAYFISSDGGINWANITANIPADLEVRYFTGDGTKAYLAGVDISNPNAKVINIYTSSDNGVSGWNLTMDGINTANLQTIDDDEDILLVTPAEGKAFLHITYLDWDQKLFRWNEGAWQAVSASGMDHIDIESMEYNDGKLFVSRWNNGVYQSADDGDTFSKMEGLPEGLNASKIVFQGDDVIISTNRGIWRYNMTTEIISPVSKDKAILYPNPAGDNVTVNFDTDEAGIYSISGKLIVTKEIVQNNMDISELPIGVYFVRLSSSTDQKTIKLIKQ